MLQEVFAAAFNAICADDRADQRAALALPDRPQPLPEPPAPAAARPARTRWTCSSATAASRTADTVHKREEFRQIVADVQELPETQRTALLLREIDALSYDQIAEAMETTVPSVKSLLVRARVSLAEAAEARLLTCDEVRLELGAGGRGHRPHHRARPPPPARPATAAAPSAPSCARPQGAGGDLPDRAARDPQEARGSRKLGFGGAGARGAAASGGGAAAGGAGVAGRRRSRRRGGDHRERRRLRGRRPRSRRRQPPASPPP